GGCRSLGSWLRILDNHPPANHHFVDIMLKPVLLAAAALLASCTSPAGDGAARDNDDAAVQAIDTLVVIYAENRAFDNLYGLFPGANGIPGVNPSPIGSVLPQRDFDGAVLPTLPPVWGGVTAGGQPVAIAQAQSAGLANKPFRIDDPSGFGSSG